MNIRWYLILDNLIMKQKTIYVFGLLFVLLSVISCKDDEFLKREDCVKKWI